MRGRCYRCRRTDVPLLRVSDGGIVKWVCPICQMWYASGPGTTRKVGK